MSIEPEAPAEDETTASWFIDGTEYEVDIASLSGLEWRAIRQVTGLRPPLVVVDAAIVSNDFEAIAALLWVTRRRTEPDLSYEAVLRTLSLASMTRG